MKDFIPPSTSTVIPSFLISVTVVVKTSPLANFESVSLNASFSSCLIPTFTLSLSTSTLSITPLTISPFYIS